MRFRLPRSLHALLFLALLTPPPSLIHVRLFTAPCRTWVSPVPEPPPWTEIVACRGRNRLSGPTRQETVSRALRPTQDGLDRQSLAVDIDRRGWPDGRDLPAPRRGLDSGQARPAICGRLRC